MKRRVLCLATILSVLVGCSGHTNPGMAASLARDEVIKRAKAGALKSDADGNAVLPAELKAASVEGRVYMSSAAAETGVAIVFVFSQSPESTMAYLYCDAKVPPNGSALRVGSSQWKVQRISDAHWALVSKL